MKKVTIVLSIICVCLITGLFVYFHYYNKDDPKPKSDSPIIENNNLEDEKIIEEDLIIEEKTEIDKNEDINKIEETQKSSDNKKTNSSNETNKSNNQVTTKKDNQENNNYKVETTTPEVTQPPVQQEEVKEDPKPDQIDTNSFFYSIHHGNVDTSTGNGCLNAGFEIAYIDTVDINYYRCYEVTMTSGKIIGYYLNVFCNSDNCNRYKSMIDWSKYD